MAETRAIATKVNARSRFPFHCVMRDAVATSAVTTELIICQGFGELGRSGGSKSRLAARYLWLSMLRVIIRLRSRRSGEDHAARHEAVAISLEWRERKRR